MGTLEFKSHSKQPLLRFFHTSKMHLIIVYQSAVVVLQTLLMQTGSYKRTPTNDCKYYQRFWWGEEGVLM